MASDSPDISIVVPVYDEEENLSLLYQRIRGACEPLGKVFEMVFIDDGSQDRTFEILRSLHSEDSRVKVIRFRKNYGQTAAMAAGFAEARGEIVISMDGDLQNDPADIPRLLAKMQEGFDVVCGWRKNRQDKLWTRRVPSLVANWIIGRVTGIRIHDNGCSLKAYRTSLIKHVALYGEMHRFIPAMATLTGARIAEIVVNHHPRYFGKSKYGIGRIWRVALDIVTVKMITGFASRPLLWFGLLSLPSTALGLSMLFIGLYLSLDRLIVEGTVLSTAGLCFLFLSGHLVALGGVGELSMSTGEHHRKINAYIMLHAALGGL